MPVTLSDKEAARLQALYQYQVLDTPPEQAFNDFALLAAQLCGTPVSLVSFVDETRQWFKAKVGIELAETSREVSFCAHAILQRDVFIVPDAMQDDRFAGNALVTESPNIRFYAGAPLVTPSGQALGTLCVIDTVPRVLTPAQIKSLEALSRQAVAQLELRRTVYQVQEQSESLRLLEAAIQQSNDAITITTAELNMPGPQIVFVNPAYTRITGYSHAEAVGSTPRILQGPRTERPVLDYLKSQLSQGLPFSGETINYRKDGSEFWMEWEIAPVRTTSGFITHFVATQRDATTRRDTRDRLRSQFERLTALHAIDASILMQRDLTLTLGLLLDQIVLLLGVDAADVLLLNPHTGDLERAVRRGYEKGCMPPTHVTLGEGLAGRAYAERRMITLADMQEEAAEHIAWEKASGFADHYAVPLVTKGRVRGVLRLCQQEPIDQDQAWWEFLETLCGQAAIAIDNSQLLKELEDANEQLVRSYDTTIEGWARALDLRDKETEGHSRRVTEMTLRLSTQMGVRAEEMERIRRGALLHDIGKMGIPDYILLKPGKLNAEEWDIMRQHPQLAYDLLYPIPFLRQSLDIPYCHHEKWDGTGYPNELKGEQIPLCARIFAIVDVWDALRSDRPYRAGWPVEKVREHIRALSGTHFDPAVAKSFLQLSW